MTRAPARPHAAAMPMPRALRSPQVGALFVGVLVFGFALLGIFTRPVGALAAFWPANAVLLGMLVRWPTLAHPFAWCAAAIALVSADLLTGGTWAKATHLSAANLVGVAVGYLLFMRLSPEHRTLRSTQSMVYFLVIVTLASLAVGLAGMFINPRLFGGTPVSGLWFWFTSELVDYLVILPVVLTMPAWQRPRLINRRGSVLQGLAARQLLPVCTLLLGALLTKAFNGPGAIAYLVPGLLWCALSYSLFTTALLTLISSAWVLMAVSAGQLHFGADFSAPYALQSFRIAIALIVMGPLTVATVMDTRSQLLRQLLHAATHDPLTDCLNRSGFADQAASSLSALRSTDRPAAVLMLDIDHFKMVNDRHGHAIGDQVLAATAAQIAHALRSTDLLGRWGGEEFAILLPSCSPEEALQVAQRICEQCAQQRVPLPGTDTLGITVSIGLASFPTTPASLEAALARADEALYCAKGQGRNRVAVAPPH